MGREYTIIKRKEHKNSGGFTLIELVMTIILIGIMSVGLYQVVIFGINDYMTNESYLHSNNAMTYAVSVLRRNLTNAVAPAALISPSGLAYCPVSNSVNPYNNGNPVVIADLKSQSVACDGAGQPVCSEAVFYQNIIVNGTAGQQLVVFCVHANNNKNSALYKEVTNSNGKTVSYPVANNISSINF